MPSRGLCHLRQGYGTGLEALGCKVGLYGLELRVYGLGLQALEFRALGFRV